MYIVDTNVFLEGLLDREKASSVRKFLRKTPIDTLCITDFSLHTLGVILFRFELISFDKDFDKTDLKRKEPSEIIV